MLRLLLIRHAKSSWQDDLLSDHERPLKESGISDSQLMGKVLLEKSLIPDSIFSSTAVRTAMTVEILNRAFELPSEDIYYDAVLYSAWAADLLKFIKENARSSNLMLVGHNPGIHELAERLADTHLEKFHTAAIASITFDCDSWSNLEFGRGKLEQFLFPKMFY